MLVLAVVGVLLVIAAVATALPSSDNTGSAQADALQLRQVVTGAELDGKPCPSATSSPDAATLCSKDKSLSIDLGPVLVDGADVATAEAVESTGPDGGWVVNISLNEQGTEDFATATGIVVNSPPPANRIAVVVDDAVVIVPEINEPITSGQLEVGGFTQSEAEDLAAQLS